jgi:two-component system CheB/CheR fusion protein
VQIFATDIDDHALARARQGIYPQSIELDLSPDRLARFFTKHDKSFQVTRAIRDMIVFAPHNLGKDPPFSRLDLVSCRNVLIYMQPALQRRALRTFHYALKPDGFLLLGTSESVGDAADLFTLVDRKLKIYAKKNVASAAVFELTAGLRIDGAGRRAEGAASGERRPVALSLQQLADRKILDKYGPPGVLVDDNLDVIQFRGRTGTYLDPTPGAPTFNILKLVRPELVIPLRTALQRASKENIPIVTEPITLWGDRGSAGVSLDVMPLAAESGRRCLVVLFHEVAATEGDAAARPPPSEDLETEPRILQLERELLMTKEYLQTTIQELESANEELQSSNEELQSSNEELQSSNEELETSKEELQSTNEELATVNDELESRMAQLNISNDDLQNVLADSSSPLVIVGMDLRIRRFSAAAEKLLNLIPSDVGRLVGCLAAPLNVSGIEALVAETINNVRDKEQRVRVSEGQWYTLRVVPYRTGELAIRGAVLELTRAPPVRRAGDPAEIHELVGKILSTLPSALVLLDDQLRMVWSNKTFFDTFQVGTEILGRPLEEVWGARERHPELWKQLEDTLTGGRPFDDVELDSPLPGTARRMRFSARRIAAEADRPALTLVAMAAMTPPPAEGAG